MPLSDQLALLRRILSFEYVKVEESKAQADTEGAEDTIWYCYSDHH